MDCCSFSYFSLFPPTRKKRYQKVTKLLRNRLKRSYKLTKLAILAASWQLLAATCCQLDPNLVLFALSCCQTDLTASTLNLFASIAIPCFAQVRASCRPWLPSWRQLGATSLKIYQNQTFKSKQLKTSKFCANLVETTENSASRASKICSFFFPNYNFSLSSKKNAKLSSFSIPSHNTSLFVTSLLFDRF
jgi:hypothetical protein